MLHEFFAPRALKFGRNRVATGLDPPVPTRRKHPCFLSNNIVADFPVSDNPFRRSAEPRANQVPSVHAGPDGRRRTESSSPVERQMSGRVNYRGHFAKFSFTWEKPAV